MRIAFFSMQVGVHPRTFGSFVLLSRIVGARLIALCGLALSQVSAFELHIDPIHSAAPFPLSENLLDVGDETTFSLRIEGCEIRERFGRPGWAQIAI